MIPAKIARRTAYKGSPPISHRRTDSSVESVSLKEPGVRVISTGKEEITLLICLFHLTYAWLPFKLSNILMCEHYAVTISGMVKV